MASALLDFPWWAYPLVALALTHVTIAAVTIFLHRHQAHRALELHPAISHFFRFWLWLTTGIITREWVAIHRKHHAHCDQAQDPHSPRIYGIRRVLWGGAELYREAAHDQEMLERYGSNTPDDWLERRLYGPHSLAGIGSLLVIELVLFGPIGLSIWAVQMAWIPIFAAGVINGIGHHWGYRSFATRDASRNILPWGILIGGEDLHNNHHAYASSARLSNRWWEIDLGWLYIRGLAALGLANVKRVAPRLRVSPGKSACDAETVQAILLHRCDVFARYARSLRRTLKAEMQALRTRAPDLHMPDVVGALHRWSLEETPALSAPDARVLALATGASPVLDTVCTMREELAALWQRSTQSREQLVAQFEAWCQRADASSIDALRDFSRTLRGYAMR